MSDQEFLDERQPATHSLESFLARKEAICAKLEKAILDTLEAMGPDIAGIDWFSSAAGEYKPEEK